MKNSIWHWSFKIQSYYKLFKPNEIFSRQTLDLSNFTKNLSSTELKAKFKYFRLFFRGMTASRSSNILTLWRFKYSVPSSSICATKWPETLWLYKLTHFQNDLSCEICLNFLLTLPHLNRSLIFKCENMFMKISFGRDSMVKVESFGFLSFTLQILRRFGLSILQVTVISKNFSLPEKKIKNETRRGEKHCTKS